MIPQLTLTHLVWVVVATLPVRWAPPRVWGVWRTAVGAAWLAWWDWRSCVGLFAVSVVLWLGADRARRAPQVARFLGWGLLTAVFLGVRIATHLGVTGIVPLGFGFAILRLGHYWEERLNRTLPAHGWFELFGWLTYLPTFLVGPVQRFEDWHRWERRHRFDAGDTAAGLRRLLLGYLKVVVLAYTVFGDWLVGHAGFLPAPVALGLSGLLVLYAAFSGYADMAIGLGLVWGQRVPENFANPFAAASLPDFWRAWHMTVSDWCRTYVFLPVLARTRRAGLAAAVAIAVFAFWHELTLAYAAWGLWHALGVLLWRRFGPKEPSWFGRVIGRGYAWAWMLTSYVGLAIWPRGTAWYMR